MPLISFLLDISGNDNKFIKIYKKFVEIQNRIIKPLLDIKIQKAIFSEIDKEEVPVQNINKEEILNFNLENDYQSFNNLILIYSNKRYFYYI